MFTDQDAHPVVMFLGVVALTIGLPVFMLWLGLTGRL